MSSTTTIRRISAGPADLPEGGRRLVPFGSRSIGVFRVNARYHAVLNHCPHEGAELCRGSLTGTTLPTDQPGTYEWGREGAILRCPWHQWEFDLETGRHLADPSCRVRVYRVVELDGELFLEL